MRWLFVCLPLFCLFLFKENFATNRLPLEEKRGAVSAVCGTDSHTFLAVANTGFTKHGGASEKSKTVLVELTRTSAFRRAKREIAVIPGVVHAMLRHEGELFMTRTQINPATQHEQYDFVVVDIASGHILRNVPLPRATLTLSRTNDGVLYAWNGSYRSVSGDDGHTWEMLPDIKDWVVMTVNGDAAYTLGLQTLSRLTHTRANGKFAVHAEVIGHTETRTRDLVPEEETGTLYTVVEKDRQQFFARPLDGSREDTFLFDASAENPSAFIELHYVRDNVFVYSFVENKSPFSAGSKLLVMADGKQYLSKDYYAAPFPVGKTDDMLYFATYTFGSQYTLLVLDMKQFLPATHKDEGSTKQMPPL